MAGSVAVAFGGPSAEHAVSILTGLQACRVLAATGADVLGLYWSASGEWYAVRPDLEAPDFTDGVPSSARPLNLVAAADGGFFEPSRLGRSKRLDVDVVLNSCHGGPGEDGHLQAALDLAGVPYTGPSAAGAMLGMDKLAFGHAMVAAGIPALPRFALRAGGPAPDLPLPWIVKPRFGGSSYGIEVVGDVQTAQDLVRSSPALREGAVAEPFRAGAVDLNVAVRRAGTPLVSVIEEPQRSADAGAYGSAIYTTADKYKRGGLDAAPRQLPADLPPAVEARVLELAAAVAEVAEVRGAARIDLLRDGDEVWVNEINTIPGSHGLYLWRASGTTNEEVLRSMITEARSSVAYRTPPADQAEARSILAAASSISSKLG